MLLLSHNEFLDLRLNCSQALRASLAQTHALLIELDCLIKRQLPLLQLADNIFQSTQVIFKCSNFFSQLNLELVGRWPQYNG